VEEQKEAKLRRGQAIAMQSVAFLLIGIASDIDRAAVKSLLRDAKTISGADPWRHTMLGSAWVLHFVAAFGIELSLKALRAREGFSPRHCHNLLTLFNDLLPATRSKLETQFRHDTQHTRPGVALSDFLREHRNDFLEWRYLDKPKSLTSGDAGLLQLAMCAMLETYESLS